MKAIPRAARGESTGFLPLKPAWFHVLLTLAAQPSHGYAIRQAVEARTDGQIRLWPATLYGTLGQLLAAGLIDECQGSVPDDDLQRRTYRLTPPGRQVLVAETERLNDLLRLARAAIARRRTT